MMSTGNCFAVLGISLLLVSIDGGHTEDPTVFLLAYIIASDISPLSSARLLAKEEGTYKVNGQLAVWGATSAKSADRSILRYNLLM
jgi:hypothetical protein